MTQAQMFLIYKIRIPSKLISTGVGLQGEENSRANKMFVISIGKLYDE